MPCFTLPARPARADKNNKREHRGFGFVTFETEAAIQRVVRCRTFLPSSPGAARCLSPPPLVPASLCPPCARARAAQLPLPLLRPHVVSPYRLAAARRWRTARTRSAAPSLPSTLPCRARCAVGAAHRCWLRGAWAESGSRAGCGSAGRSCASYFRAFAQLQGAARTAPWPQPLALLTRA